MAAAASSADEERTCSESRRGGLTEVAWVIGVPSAGSIEYTLLVRSSGR